MRRIQVRFRGRARERERERERETMFETTTTKCVFEIIKGDLQKWTEKEHTREMDVEKDTMMVREREREKERERKRGRDWEFERLKGSMLGGKTDREKKPRKERDREREEVRERVLVEEKSALHSISAQ